MSVFQSCSDTKDLISLYVPQKLYLKPVAYLNISVQLPSLKLSGKTISNSEVMEKLRYWAKPEEFTVLKVSKSTLEFIRFEGEIENKSKLTAVLARLDGRYIKLSGFTDPLKVRAAESRPDFPTRHTWDSYFRDAKNMNEMKPGERPDTIHFLNLPSKWFASKQDPTKPSESILRKVFESYGEIRYIDIPILDPYRSKMRAHISGVKMFSHNQNMIFEAYVQYKEYFCFVKAMDALRGMKLVQKDEEGKIFTANIKVDFDKTRHLSDGSIRKRRIERERLIAKEREKEEQERQALEKEEAKKEAERKKKQAEKEAKLERRKLREEKRKAKQITRLKQLEADEMNKKIATEERLLLMAQRRLESIRMLGALFNRIKQRKEDELGEKLETKGNKSKQLKNDKALNKEQELRDKLIKHFRSTEALEEKKKRSRRYSESKNISLSDSDTESATVLPNTEGDVNSLNDPKNFPGLYLQHGRGNWTGRGRGRGNQFPPNSLNFQYPNRGGFYPRRRGFRWPRYPPIGRGGYFPPIDPFFLDINHQYYKYFQRVTYKDRKRSNSKSTSRSRSRSYSKERRRRSRSYTRSRSYSRSKSYSRNYSKSYSRSYSRSRSRSYSKSRSRVSRSKTHSRSKEKSLEKPVDCIDQVNTVEKVNETISNKQTSAESAWSPSKSMSLSIEKNKNEEQSKRKHKHKKDKKKKKKRNKEH